MKLIQSHMVVRRPQRCAVVPYLGPTSGHRFIDTGQDMDDWHRVYVSEPAFEEMAKLFGTWVRRGELRLVIKELEDTREALLASQQEVERLAGVVSAVDVIESADFRARKKAGRPKVEV